MEPLLLAFPEESDVDGLFDSDFEVDASGLLDAEESEDGFDSLLELSPEGLVSAAADFL